MIHRSSFGEHKDKEGTLGSFVMSFDVEVYVGTKINDEKITPPPVLKRDNRYYLRSRAEGEAVGLMLVTSQCPIDPTLR